MATKLNTNIFAPLDLSFEDDEWEASGPYKERNIVRAIVYVPDNNKFAFIEFDRDDKFGQGTFVETSGGGMEEGENEGVALERELGEELGFTGSCITIFLLFLIVLECIITAVRARNFEGRLICCGVAIYIGFQTFINIGVVSWILPNTGVPLPFFSCGITSLLTLFIAMGIVLNVSLQRNVERDDDMFADDFRG